ncbi:MAG: hypothetical protein LBC85_03660 [Fibromonadaceae bacterium]|jgi:hypothetical protein|nr:hypothetical protein [Fibromonadaceae bacterium]
MLELNNLYKLFGNFEKRSKPTNEISHKQQVATPLTMINLIMMLPLFSKKIC